MGRNPHNKATRREQLFAEEYQKHFNAVRACIAAGYSERSAHVTSSRLLNSPRIKALLQEIVAKDREKISVTREMIIRELAKIAFTNATEYLEEDGSLKPISEISETAAGALAGIEIEERKIGEGMVAKLKKIKVADKRAALADLAKMLGYNEPDKLLVKSQEAGPDEVLFE